MGVTDIVHLLEIVEGSLNKCSITLTYISAPTKQNTSEAVPAILLLTVDQPLVLPQVLMPKATGLHWWKLEIIVRSKVVTVKVVLFTFTQRAPSLNHVSYVNVGW